MQGLKSSRRPITAVLGNRKRNRCKPRIRKRPVQTSLFSPTRLSRKILRLPAPRHFGTEPHISSFVLTRRISHSPFPGAWAEESVVRVEVEESPKGHKPPGCVPVEHLPRPFLSVQG